MLTLWKYQCFSPDRKAHSLYADTSWVSVQEQHPAEDNVYVVWEGFVLHCLATITAVGNSP